MSTSRSRHFFIPTRLTSSLWLVIPLALSPLSLAHAYLDPGSGSYVIQIAIGIIFGTAYAFRNFIGMAIRTIKKWLGKKDDKDTEEK